MTIADDVLEKLGLCWARMGFVQIETFPLPCTATVSWGFDFCSLVRRTPLRQGWGVEDMFCGNAKCKSLTTIMKGNGGNLTRKLAGVFR